MTFLPSLSTVVILSVIFGLLFALLRRPFTALALVLYFVGFALLSSYMKQAYLGSAMTLADMHFFFLRPRENFYILVNYPVLGLTALAVVGCFALIGFVGVRFEKPLVLERFPGARPWWRASVASAAIALGIGGLIVSANDAKARANDGDAYAAFLSMYEQQNPGNAINRLNIFFNNRSFEAALPVKRDQQRFVSSPETQSESIATEPKPDVFFILEESTFDPTLIKSCPKVDCDNTMLHPLPTAKRTQQGPLLVHTTGGGTWLAEFAVMSGFDWRVFGKGGAYAPVSLAPRLKASLPLRFKELGYRTIAVYPTLGNFLSATAAYGYYGFDEFYDAKLLKLPDEWGDVRDSLVFDKAMQMADRDRDPRPVFVFVLTIRNHGPHGNHPEKIQPAFKKAVTQTTIYMADYLGRMRDSSKDFTEFAAKWLKSPRPSVIAWFGDHQPEAAWDFTSKPDLLRDARAMNVSVPQLQYLTYYQLSANFGDKSQQVATDALDLSYLGTELVAFSGLPLDDGEGAARVVAKQCNGLLIDCADRDLVNDYLSFRIHQLGAVK